MPFLSQIHIYPVKSLAGIQVQSWPVDDNGLKYDRKWMLIDADNQFLSQRRLPKMALIKTRMEDDKLILSAPGLADVSLPLSSNQGETLPVQIWDDLCQAKTVSADIDRWLSGFLQSDCRLVYHPDDNVRQVDQRFAAASDQTAFSDGFPFLIVAESSLQALNTAMQLELSMQRFRPNLVVADCASFAEDSWRRIAINGISFRLPKPCSRCSVPAIDPETGVAGKEPLTTLNRLRKADNKVYFGQNALHDQSGRLSIGDQIELLETGTPQPLLAG
jgi:uncharacterized protein YcbX